jgi:hypothetical protein
MIGSPDWRIVGLSIAMNERIRPLNGKMEIRLPYEQQTHSIIDMIIGLPIEWQTNPESSARRQSL